MGLLRGACILAPTAFSIALCLVAPVDYVTDMQHRSVVAGAKAAARRDAKERAALKADQRQEERERQQREREARQRAAERAQRDRRQQQEAAPPSTPAPAGSPRDIARALVSADQWGCLDALWTRESNWRWDATNPTSGAYGIPQALPASKMASAGADWRTNPATQIRWGLSYIEGRYGSPCGAWAHSERVGWY